MSDFMSTAPYIGASEITKSPTTKKQSTTIKNI